LASNTSRRRTQWRIEGILPLYLKNHSQGEYVFDHAWADALERAGGDYYPKLKPVSRSRRRQGGAA